MLKKVRDGNAMADLALARLSWRIHNWGIGLYEQPWDSFAWQLPRAVAMHRTGRFWATRLCNGCHGGRRVKWTCVWHNCEKFHAAFHQEFFAHSHETGYSVAVDPDSGHLVFDTAQEAEYPEQMCKEMAAVFVSVLKDFQAAALPMQPSQQQAWLAEELRQSTRRLAGAAMLRAASAAVHKMLSSMRQGREEEHLRRMLSLVDYRGTDARLDDSQGLPLAHQGLPYPAFAWAWVATQAYPWQQEQHINILEAVAMLNHVRRLSQDVSAFGVRQFHVLDSQVVASVVARGRSSSRRLNRVARRLTAFVIAMDLYVHTLWTISRWMGCDQASRLFEL